VEGFVLDGSPEPVRVGRAEVAFFRVRTLDAEPLPEDGEALRITAEARGDYEVWLSPGIWYAEARRPESRVPWLLGAEGRPPTSRLLAVGDKTSTRHDLTVLPERTVSGVVLRAPDDRPVAGARVLLSLHVRTVPEDRPPRAPDLRREAPTGEDGGFTFEGLPPLGRMVFRVIDPRSGVILAEAVTWVGGPESGSIVLRTGVEGTASARGRVIDDQARPVPGAMVMIGGRPLEAGADGRFLAVRLPAGTASVLAFALGYAPTEAVMATLRAKERLDLPDLILSRAGVEVRGRVGDEAGEPIPGARVRVDFGGEAVYETRSGPDGTWSQRGPGTGEEGCHVTVSAVGYGRAGGPVRLEPLEERADFALADLSPGITGRLHPRPRLGGVALLLAPGDGPPAQPGSWSRAVAEFDGRDFTVRDVPAGRYLMRLVAGGIAVRDLGLQTVKAGETLDLGKVFAQPGGTIRGRVEPPAASESLLIGIAILDLWTPVASDGSFLLDGIPPGVFDLRTWSDKHHGQSLTVEIRAHRETEVHFRR
jgi:hypothetical protein